MDLDKIVHNRIAQLLGDSLIRQTTAAAEAELLRQQVEELHKQLSDAQTAAEQDATATT